MDEERQIRRYLLGQLAEADQQRIDERFFLDDEFHEKMQTLERELIDAYVRGELDEDERRPFETYYLATPRRREKVAFARVLLRGASPAAAAAQPEAPAADQPARRWWRRIEWSALRPIPSYLLAAAGLVIVIGGVALRSQIRQLQTQVALLAAERQALQKEKADLQQQLAKEMALRRELQARIGEPSPRIELPPDIRLDPSPHQPAQTPQDPSPPPLPPRSAVTLSLSPGESSAVLTRPPAARPVELQLKLGPLGDYKQYRVTLRSPETHWTRSHEELSVRMAGAESAVILREPSERFAPGFYQVMLEGMQAGGEWAIVGRYTFRVVRR